MLIWPKNEIFGYGVFPQTRPVWVGDLGTRPKNPKLGWFRPKNRQFILFNAVGYSAKKKGTYMHASTSKLYNQ